MIISVTYANYIISKLFNSNLTCFYILIYRPIQIVINIIYNKNILNTIIITHESVIDIKTRLRIKSKLVNVTPVSDSPKSYDLRLDNGVISVNREIR